MIGMGAAAGLFCACAVTTPLPSSSAPAGPPVTNLTCQDGRQGVAATVSGVRALGVTFETDPLADPLPRAADAGVIAGRPEASLFWKAPLNVDSADPVTISVEAPAYLAYVPPGVWTHSTAGGVQVEPWVSRTLHISPCDDGASQSYLGGFLVGPAQQCIRLTIASGDPGRERTATVRLATAPGSC